MNLESLLADRKKPATLLSLDPGGTIGFSVFQNGHLLLTGQLKGESQSIHDLFDRYKPTEVVCEDYRVYAHKLQQHSYSNIPTLRLIGAIEYVCNQSHLLLSLQMASLAKGFVTDKKLKEWGLYQIRQPHANDALRHACYYLLFSQHTLYPKNDRVTIHDSRTQTRIFNPQQRVRTINNDALARLSGQEHRIPSEREEEDSR